jgi:hypothetical protein
MMMKQMYNTTTMYRVGRLRLLQITMQLCFSLGDSLQQLINDALVILGKGFIERFKLDRCVLVYC